MSKGKINFPATTVKPLVIGSFQRPERLYREVSSVKSTEFALRRKKEINKKVFYCCFFF